MKSILVVDDEHFVRDVVGRALANAGYEVATSHDGSDALLKITQRHFDAIISDILMPGISGLELVSALRKLCADTVVILLTAVPDRDGKMRGMAEQAGISAFLNKPCTVGDLKAALTKAFAEQEAYRESFLSLEKFTQGEVSILTQLISEATRNAVSGIADMVGREVQVISGDHRRVPARDVGELLRNPEDTLVGINLDIEGDTSGHILLIYPPRVAYGLVDLIMGEPLGKTTSLEGVEESALQEMGNIAGSFFLNSLADAAAMRLMSTPPTLIVGKAQRVLDNAFRPLATKGAEVFAIQTIFQTNGAQVSGYFLALASIDFLNTLVGRVSDSRSAV